MTNHSYFNLSGDPTQTVLNDSLCIASNQMTPTNEALIPTGEIADIAEGSPFDFLTHMKTVGQDIEADDVNLKMAGGYDHNWIIKQPQTEELLSHAILYNVQSGIILAVLSDQPGIQCYTGNFLNGSVTGKKGIKYQKRTGICLETQRYPDSPNKPEWPTTTLRPGETYNTVTVLLSTPTTSLQSNFQWESEFFKLAF